MQYFVLLSIGILEVIAQVIISTNQMFQTLIDFRYSSYVHRCYK